MLHLSRDVLSKLSETAYPQKGFLNLIASKCINVYLIEYHVLSHCIAISLSFSFPFLLFFQQFSAEVSFKVSFCINQLLI